MLGDNILPLAGQEHLTSSRGQAVENLSKIKAFSPEGAVFNSGSGADLIQHVRDDWLH